MLITLEVPKTTRCISVNYLIDDWPVKRQEGAEFPLTNFGTVQIIDEVDEAQRSTPMYELCDGGIYTFTTRKDGTVTTNLTRPAETEEPAHDHN